MTDRSVELAHAAAMPAPQGGALPTGLEWQALERMAHMLADSNLIPYQLKQRPGDVAVILLAAREYGIPPLMALSKLPVVNGKPAPMGELMVALVLRAGHSIRADFKAPDGTRYKGGALTPQHYGEAIVRRRDWPAGVEESLTFTLEEAVTAGLVDLVGGRPRARDKKDNPTPWELYTPNMARWRAVANVCRLYFPDVLLGLSYLPEELGAVVDEDGAPVVGEVVPPRSAPTGNLEQRTAQEDADKLAEQPWPDHVIDAVRRKATESGYVDAEVTYAGERMTLEEALGRHVADRQHADTVDDVIVDDEPGESPEDGDAPVVEGEEATEEPASAPQQPEQPIDGPTEQDQQRDEAYDLAREALNSSDKGLLLTIYRGLEDLAEVDVLPVVDDGDLHTLGAPSDLTSLRLGALVMAAGKYVGEHGIAVRQPAPRTAEEQIADTPDPWADGSGMAPLSAEERAKREQIVDEHVREYDPRRMAQGD